MSAQTNDQFEVGNDLYEQGDFDGALGAYRSALREPNADLPAIHNNVGLALCQFGRYEEGLAEFRIALESAPRDADLLNNIGEALVELKRFDEAVGVFTSAAELMPEDAVIQASLGGALCRVGNYRTALDHFRKAVILDPDDETSIGLISRIEAYLEADPLAAAESAQAAAPAADSVNASAAAAAKPLEDEEPLIGELIDDAPALSGTIYMPEKHGLVPASRPPVIEITLEPFDNGSVSGKGSRGQNFRLKKRPQVVLARIRAGDWKEASSNLFWRIVGLVLIFHVVVLVLLYLTGSLNQYVPQEIRVPIILMPPEVTKSVKKPPPLPPAPLGVLRPYRPRVTRMAERPMPHLSIRSTRSTPARAIALAPKFVAPTELPPQPVQIKIDAPSEATNTQDAPPDPGNIAVKGPPAQGEAPTGFPNGTINGRVYFIRLKHDIGDWYAHQEGTTALLAFMNKYFRCEAENRPMTAEEIQDNYISKGLIPSFIYISCDENFSLTDREASILQGYLQQGGFLFVDSVPDEQTRQTVADQLARILPGTTLAPLSASHPINSFLFHLRQPGIGENWSDQHNYGITIGNRLAVFYSPGNLADYYELSRDKSDEYTISQFQMGANVVSYAISKGIRDNIQVHPVVKSTSDGAFAAVPDNR